MPGKESASRKAIGNQMSCINQFQPLDRVQEKYILKLYISGMTLRSTLAVENIRRICQDYLPGRCDLEIIDIFKHPALAKEANVIAAPTLIKKYPLPVHRLIGDLSNTEKVLIGLKL
jgi:circadian clock protein KaiB